MSDPRDPMDPRREPGETTPPETASAPSGDVFDASIAGVGTPPMARPASAAASSPAPSTRDERTTVRVRRSPKLGRFAIAGGVVGVIVALILTFAFPDDSEFTAGQVFGFLALFCVVVFGTLGAVVALIVERSSRARAREVQADRQVTTEDDTAA